MIKTPTLCTTDSVDHYSGDMQFMHSDARSTDTTPLAGIIKSPNRFSLCQGWQAVAGGTATRLGSLT